MQNIEGGYYIKARSAKNSWIAHAPPCVREIWDWLLMNASFAGSDGRDRGQVVCSYDDIREGLHWTVGFRKGKYSKWDCERAIKSLVRTGMVRTERASTNLLVTVLNYEKYQDPGNYRKRKTAKNIRMGDERLHDGHNGSHDESHNSTIETGLDTAKINASLPHESHNESHNGSHMNAEMPPQLHYIYKKDKNKKGIGETTPNDEMVEFLESEAVRESYASKYADRVGLATAREEIAKFAGYWSERTRDGKRQLWQTKDAFEVGRRLGTWMSRVGQKAGETKPSASKLPTGRVRLHDGTEAVWSFGRWTDANDRNVTLDTGYYPELTKL